MSRAVVGVDPHKKQVTIEAVDQDGQVVAVGELGTDSRGYRLMLRYVREQWPHHRWAMDGANGVGRPLA
jgi:transposase